MEAFTKTTSINLGGDSQLAKYQNLSQQQKRKKNISFNTNNTIDVDETDDSAQLNISKFRGNSKINLRDKQKSLDYVIKQPGLFNEKRDDPRLKKLATIDVMKESTLTRSFQRFPNYNDFSKCEDNALPIETSKQTISSLKSTKKGLNIPTKEELLQERLSEIRKRSTISSDTFDINRADSLKKCSLLSNFLATMSANNVPFEDNTLKKQATIQQPYPSFKALQDGTLNNFDISQYEIIEELSESNLGKFYKVHDLTEKPFTMLKIISSSSKEVNHLFSYLEIVSKLKQNGLLQPQGVSIMQVEKSYFIINVLFDACITSNLDKEINKLQSTNVFKENELIEILRQSATTLSSIHTLHISHGSISPDNIMITKIHDQPSKLATSLTIPFHDILKSELLTFNDNRLLKEVLRKNQSFLSPPLYSMLSSNRLYLKHDKYKSDVYSLGMTILYAMTLNLKALAETRFKYDLASTKKVILKYAKTKYSTKLIDLISMMLVIEERQRLSIQSVLQRLELIAPEAKKK